ncbi:hypothetical protein L1049_018650 [Liquidambar formosana]|uniref:Uncharacterized protein n=1 Tax=Liquidambar formosana TaxID=63359 RepID=A0AAP0RBF0_LIQFO
MSTNEAPQKIAPPKLVILDKALKLAEQWVDNMSGSLEDESTEVDLEGRPSRLGLGAKVLRQCKVGPSNDPVERKLHAKLNAGKRKAAQSTEETIPSARDGCGDDDEEDEDSESRTKVFSKKRVISLTSSLKAKKKLK